MMPAQLTPGETITLVVGVLGIIAFVERWTKNDERRKATLEAMFRVDEYHESQCRDCHGNQLRIKQEEEE